LQIHQRDKTWEMAQEKGEYIMKRIESMIGAKIISVRGLGMEIGIQFKDDETCRSVQRAAFADGLHIVVGGDNNIQIMPPLTIPQDLLDRGLDILAKHAA
jgi:4-aminobutyrate aminotransferase-like enzyme